MAEKPEAPTETKRKRSALPTLVKKLGQVAKQIEHGYQREEGMSDERLVKLRSILAIALPGFERQLRISKICDEPGVREFLQSMKMRV